MTRCLSRIKENDPSREGMGRTQVITPNHLGQSLEKAKRRPEETPLESGTSDTEPCKVLRSSRERELHLGGTGEGDGKAGIRIGQLLGPRSRKRC